MARKTRDVQVRLTWGETVARARLQVDTLARINKEWWEAQGALHDAIEEYVCEAPETADVRVIANYVLDEIGYTVRERNRLVAEPHFLEAIDIVCMNVLPSWQPST